MARINFLIKAFKPDEISLLVRVMEREEQRTIEDGELLSELFLNLRDAFQDAKRYIGS